MVSTVETQLSAAKLPDDVLDDVDKRLARLEGQIRGLRRLIGEGAGCKDVIHQVSAASAALDKVGYRLVGAGMQYCINEPESPMTSDDLESLFLKLS
jgi:DNA-binding FrmR family transcriptional regulator